MIGSELPELGRSFRDALWALSIPVFIIVGIRYGIFTPTEAGAITVVYTILVGRFAYRNLHLSDLPKVMKETALDTASVMLIDDFERQIADINRRLRGGHADHPYVPLLLSVPGIGWVLAFTIAAEIGETERFSSPQS